MNQKRVIYILFALVIMLILLNILLVSFVFFNRFPNNDARCEGERERGEFLVKTLDLNPQQEASFNELRKEHQSIVEPLHNEIRKNKNEFFAGIKNEKVDTLAIDSLSKLITELHRKIDIATFYHFKKIRAICNAAQQQKFEKLVEEGIFMPNSERGPMRHLRN